MFKAHPTVLGAIKARTNTTEAGIKIKIKINHKQGNWNQNQNQENHFIEGQGFANQGSQGNWNNNSNSSGYDNESFNNQDRGDRGGRGGRGFDRGGRGFDEEEEVSIEVEEDLIEVEEEEVDLEEEEEEASIIIGTETETSKIITKMILNLGQWVDGINLKMMCLHKEINQLGEMAINLHKTNKVGVTANKTKTNKVGEIVINLHKTRVKKEAGDVDKLLLY